MVVTPLPVILHNMRILLYEHYTAGAEPADAAEEAQARVHRALLAALAVDLGRIGQHEVHLASAWPATTLAEDRQWAEAVILLAPESDDRLTMVADEFTTAGLRLLGPSAAAIRLVSDKMGLTLALGEAGLKVPRTWAVGFDRPDQVERIANRIGFPIVIKPLAGAGGRGARLVASMAEIGPAIDHVRGVTSWDDFLVQEFLPGMAAGVGIVVAAGRAQALGLWGALTSEPPALIVERCATPFDHPAVEAAIALAVQAACAIPGLQGYVEVDLRLTDDGPVLLEIAPRPLLGTLALRRSLRLNLAEVILDACLEERLPDRRLALASWPALVDLDNPGTALEQPEPG